RLAGGDSRGGFRLGRWWDAHVPLTNAIAVAALEQIEVDVLLVVAVGARTEHRGETAAGALVQIVAQVLGNVDVGQGDEGPVRQREAAHIDGIGLAVLTDFAVDLAVAAAAFEVVGALDTGERGSRHGDARRGLIAQPRSKLLRHRTLQQRRGLHLDALVAVEQHRIDLYEVAATARVGADQTRHWFDDGDRFEARIAIGELGGNGRGVEIRTSGLAERMWLAPHRRRRRHYCRPWTRQW